MVEPENTQLKKTPFSNGNGNAGDDGNDPSEEENASVEIDISEEDLDKGDDFIAAALAALENYTEDPVETNAEVWKGNAKNGGNGVRSEENGLPENAVDQQKLAVLHNRIQELEKKLANVREESRHKLEIQGKELKDARKVARLLRDTCEELKKSVVKTKEESEENKRKWQETVASYVNYQKHAKKKLSEYVEMEKMSIVREFLPVIDNVRRPLEYDNPSESLMEGVRLTYQYCEDFLQSLDVKVIPAKGESFDPYCHEAVNRIPDETVPSNTILEELQTGYLIGDRVLRPSKVSVSYRNNENGNQRIPAKTPENLREKDADATGDPESAAGSDGEEFEKSSLKDSNLNLNPIESDRIERSPKDDSVNTGDADGLENPVEK